jgi:hypothetical protein
LIISIFYLIMAIRKVEVDGCSPLMSVTVKSITYAWKCSLHIIFKCQREKEKKKETTNYHLFVILSSPILMLHSFWHWTLLFYHRIKLILIPNVLSAFFFAIMFITISSVWVLILREFIIKLILLHTLIYKCLTFL